MPEPIPDTPENIAEDGSGPAIQLMPDEHHEMDIHWGMEGICFLSDKPQEKENEP